MAVRTTSESDGGLLAADLIVEDGMILLEVEVPGLEHTVLEIDASGHTLTVSGRRPFSHDGRYLLLERRRTIRRSFQLPLETDMRNLHAHVWDGVLTVSAPFGGGAPAADRTRVEVRPSIFACHPDAAPI
jgi:HSP20 family molecular chaperone IbpA